MKDLGPNHKDDCDGTDFRYSGEGYNRVTICKCGAEDHAPDLSMRKLVLPVLWKSDPNESDKDFSRRVANESEEGGSQ